MPSLKAGEGPLQGSREIALLIVVHVLVAASGWRLKKNQLFGNGISVTHGDRHLFACEESIL